MDSKKVKRRGKRFIAGFLALLLTVALLPDNTRSVVYAEESDAMEAEVSDSIAAADEGTQAADGDAVMDEGIPQVDKEESSENTVSENVLDFGGEFTALEEAETAKDPLNNDKGGDTETAGFTEKGSPKLSISGEGIISLDCPKPGDILTVNYALDKGGTDSSTIKWYKTGSDGTSELIDTEGAPKPIGSYNCYCGYQFYFTQDMSDEEKAAWNAHNLEHLWNYENTSYNTSYYDADKATLIASQNLTITDDLIGCTITAEVTPDTAYEWVAAGTAVKTDPTGAVAGADFVPVCNLEFIARDIPDGTYDHTIIKTGFTIKADVNEGSGEDNVSKTVTVAADNKTIDGVPYTARLKMGGVGTGDYRSIQFTTGDRAATLKIVCASASDDDPSRLGIGTVTKDDSSGMETLTEFTGKYKLHDGTENVYQAGGIRIDNNAGIGDTKADTVEAALAANTTYCLYTADGSGIDFLAIYVTYAGGVRANYYTLTFDANGGEAVASQRALEGERYLEPSATKTGHTLNGWYMHPVVTASGEAPSAAYKYNFSRKISKNTGIKILTAYWDKDDNNTGGGSDGGDNEGDAPAFTKSPALSIARGTSGTENPVLSMPDEGNVLTVDYTLDLAEGTTDTSTITWYRIKAGETDATIKTGVAATDGIKSYTVTGEDKGYRIKVEVTPEDSAGNTGTAKSAQTGTVKEEAEDNLIFTTPPELNSTGSVDAPKPDDVLTVSYGLTLGEGESDHSTIQWYRGGNEIKASENSTTYKVTTADIGKVISVDVTPYINESKYGKPITLVTGTVTGKQPEDTLPEGTGLRIEFDDGDVYTYTGSAIKPSITVWNNGDKLVEGTDYTVKYSNNIKASETMNENGDLVAIYADNQKKWPTVTVTGKGNLNGKKSVNFKINPKNFDNAKDDKAAVNAADVAADEGLKANDAVVLPNKKAAPVLLYGGMKLTAKDYEVIAVTGSIDDTKLAKATWAEDADNPTITLKAKSKGNYTGEVTINVIVVTAAQQKDAKIKAAFANGNADKIRYYNAESQIPGITVMNSAGENQMSSDATEADKKLEKGVDYVISYPADTTNVGTKKVTITGISANCIGTVTLSYSIRRARKTDASLEAVLTPDAANADGYDFVSTGVTVGDDLEVRYKYNGAVVETTLTEGVDYKVTYSNNKKAGNNTAAYVVTGIGNYKGLKTDKQYFTIKGIVLSNDHKSEAAGEGIQLIVGDKIYQNKKAVYKSVPSLIVNGELVKPSEYIVYYRLNETDDWSTKPDKIELGEEESFKTVYVKVEPKANKVNYISETGKELTASYNVVRAEKKDLSGAKILLQDEKGKTARVAYTGNTVTPYKAVIKIRGLEDTTIILDGNSADYESKGFKVTYANNTLKGKATVVIEAANGNTGFVGSKTATFSIVQKNFNTASFIKSLLSPNA